MAMLACCGVWQRPARRGGLPLPLPRPRPQGGGCGLGLLSNARTTCSSAHVGRWPWPFRSSEPEKVKGLYRPANMHGLLPAQEWSR